MKKSNKNEVSPQGGDKTFSSLADLTPDPANARKHNPRNVGMLVDSLHQVGAARSIVVDENGVVLAGNATIEAAAEAGIHRVKTVEADGSEIVAVVRRGLSQEQKTKLALYDNRVAELAEWNPEILAELTETKELEGLFSDKELAEILTQTGIEPKDAEPQIDKAEELRQKWGTEAGQLWVIGNHRLLVGDSTNKADVGRLWRQEKASAVVTDSPYGIERKGIENDDPQGLRELFDGALGAMPIDDAVVINFQSPRLFPVWLDAVRAAGHKFERALWFYDETDVTYPWRGWLMTSQIALVSSVGKPVWSIGVNHHDCYIVKSAGKQDDSGGHTTAKPLDVVQDLVAHTSGSLHEPFAGSGTTLVAAENLNRKCYAMEISPAYVAVCLERMTTAFPHLKIEKVNQARAA